MHMGVGDVLSTFAREAHGIRLSVAYKLARVLSTASNLKRNILKTDTPITILTGAYTKITTEKSTAGLTMGPDVTLLMLV